jgi:hypothetical protein
MGYALHRPVRDAAIRRPANAAVRKAESDNAPRAEDLFFQAGLALVLPLAFSAVADLLLLAARIGR